MSRHIQYCQRNRQDDRTNENPYDAKRLDSPEQREEDQQGMHFYVRADHIRPDHHINLSHDDGPQIRRMSAFTQ